MFCPKCGNQVPDGAAFCNACGNKLEAQAAPQPAYATPVQQQSAYQAPQQPAYQAVQQPVYVAPVQQQAAPANDAALHELAGTVLSRGITGLALAFVGIPGIIISAKAKNLAAEYERKAGGLSGKAKVGSILAKVGFPVGWAMTGFYVLYAIMLLAVM